MSGTNAIRKSVFGTGLATFILKLLVSANSMHAILDKFLIVDISSLPRSPRRSVLLAMRSAHLFDPAFDVLEDTLQSR